MVLLMLFIVVGCGHSQTKSVQKQDKPQSIQKTQATQFPVKLTDASNTKVTVKGSPKRIVSLVPSNTEILYSLGLGKQIVGVTDNDNYPADVKNKEKVGGYQLNIEKIISLHPDLVFAQTLNPKDAIQQLRNAGINVVVINNPSSFSGVYDTIQEMGQLTGKTSKAKKVIQSMKSKINLVKKKVAAKNNLPKKKVWVEISPPPAIYTSGQGTFINQMLQTIGAENAAGQLKGYPKVSSEQAISYNPDVIILSYGNQQDVQKVYSRSGWGNVKAITNKQVFTINSDLVSRPGPRLAEGVEQLAKIVYPSIFK